MAVSSLNSDPRLRKPVNPEINLVATSLLNPKHFIKSNQLEFTADSDDVGSLIFATFSLPSENSVSLVHYIDAAYPGVQIYTNPDCNPASILKEAIDFLNISISNLDWIHPQIQLTNLD